MPDLNLDLSTTYRKRFHGQQSVRDKMWKNLCSNYFQHYIDEETSILDLAAGHCEFINNIKAKRKIALDLNPDLRLYAKQGVECHVGDATDLSMFNGRIDYVWVSNFFEHVSKQNIVSIIKSLWDILEPGGKVLVLQPNIRFVKQDYWRFFDHVTPLCDRSICEVLIVHGFKIDKVIPRFLPYTTAGHIPKWNWLITLYLKVPILWRLLGGQCFVVARKV